MLLTPFVNVVTMNMEMNHYLTDISGGVTKKGKSEHHVTLNWVLTMSSSSINCTNMKILLIVAMPVELH